MPPLTGQMNFWLDDAAWTDFLDEFWGRGEGGSGFLAIFGSVFFA